RAYGAAELHLAEELARRGAVALENARLHQELGRAVRQRDEVLAAVSHDLKSPLTAIGGYVQLLRRRTSDVPEAERLRGGLEQIEDLTQRMRRLIDELVDTTRLRAGHALTLEQRPTDLVALTRAVVAAQQQATSRHHLRVETAEPELVGTWDAPRLERVLTNLLSNAVKYSPEGGEIVVTLERGAGARGPLAEVQVRDRGIGIPAAELPRLFEQYFRASNTQGRIGGTGLGLAGARAIVEQHGGTIAAESIEGQGSTFIVRLPLTEEHQGEEVGSGAGNGSA